MASFYEYSPSNTPPPEYWAVVDHKPPAPPKSERRMSASQGRYQELMPASCIPSVPPRQFALRPYDAPPYGDGIYPIAAHHIHRKPLPLPPRATPPPPPLSFGPLAPPPSLSSPSFAPSSPTLSLRSLASSTSSTSFASAASPPARYRRSARNSSAPAASVVAAQPPAPPAHQPAPSSPSSSSSSPRTLRRTPSAQAVADLRALRAQHSEACLRAAYESQLNAYLDGSIMLDAFGMVEAAVDE